MKVSTSDNEHEWYNLDKRQVHLMWFNICINALRYSNKDYAIHIYLQILNVNLPVWNYENKIIQCPISHVIDAISHNIERHKYSITFENQHHLT